MAVPLNRGKRDLIDVDAQIDSAFSAYVATDVMVESISDDSGNVRHEIWQISTGSAINPGSGVLYDAAPTGSLFHDNVGLTYRKAAASTWTSFEA